MKEHKIPVSALQSAIKPGRVMAALVLGDDLLDLFGRRLGDLRISVTDRCNFRCSYCMPRSVFNESYTYLERKELLSFAEIERLVGIFVGFGLRKVRLTGGEPLLRKNLPELVAALAKFPELEITLTSNGVLLDKFAQSLKDAGLHRLTISLDALDQASFTLLNDVDLPVQRVLDGIDATLAAGFHGTKINTVIKRNVNEHTIIDVANYCRNKKIEARFIEYMDVGNSNGWKLDEVFSAAEIHQVIDTYVSPLEPIQRSNASDVAERWRYADGSGEVGIIASVTRAFCGNCSRLRLATDGRLFTCLFADHGFDLKHLLRGGASDKEIALAIVTLWQNRQDKYSEMRSANTKLPRNKIEMSYIGG